MWLAHMSKEGKVSSHKHIPQWCCGDFKHFMSWALAFIGMSMAKGTR